MTDLAVDTEFWILRQHREKVGLLLLTADREHSWLEFLNGTHRSYTCVPRGTLRTSESFTRAHLKRHLPGVDDIFSIKARTR